MQVTYDGPPIVQTGGVRMYHDGVELKDFAALTDKVGDGHGPTVIEIYNDTPAEMHDIAVHANFPIESAEGPEMLPPGGRGSIAIVVDALKMIFMDDSARQPLLTIKYRLHRVVGGPPQ